MNRTKMESSSTPSSTPPPTTKKRGRGLWIAIAVIIIIVIIGAGAYYYFMSGSTVVADVTASDDGNCSPIGDANCKFSPTSFSTTVGKAVVFKNSGSTLHSVTGSPNSTANWSNASKSDQNLAPGSTVSVTFNTAGTYSYYCTYHQWMKGNVTVT